MEKSTQARRKTRTRKKSLEKKKDEGEFENLLRAALPKKTSRSPENTENIFLDDMIRHSKDNLFRISLHHENENLERRSHQKRRRSLILFHKPVDFFSNLVAHFSLMIRIHPKSSISLGIGLLMLLFASISHLTKSHINDLLIYNDYTDVQSVYDLEIGKIDHWCLAGDDKSCDCADPLEPQGRLHYKQWVRAQRSNTDSVKKIITSYESLDVVFLGETIVEEWQGKKMGKEYSEFEKAKLSFQSNFNVTVGGNYSGIPLGINGDTTPNVLWRLQHGEMDENFNPKIWWLIIGTNDLAVNECSEEVVLIGILRIVEEILSKKPTATIIINSILPMTLDESGRYKHTIPDGDLSENDENDDHYAPRNDGLGQHNNKRNTAWLSLFGKKYKLWSSVTAVNQQLKEFCEKNNERVLYFDADEFFLDEKKNDIFLNSELLSNHGHPTAVGHSMWHKEINKKLHEVLQK